MLCWKGLHLLSTAVIPVKRLQIFVLVLYSECSIIQQLSSPLYHFSYCSLSSAFGLIKNKSPINMANTHSTVCVFISMDLKWNTHRPHKPRDLLCIHRRTHLGHYQIHHTNRFSLCGLIMYCITSLSPIYTNTSGRYSCHILNLKLLWTSIRLLTSPIPRSLFLLTSQSAATLLSAFPCSPLSERLGSCPRSI